MAMEVYYRIYPGNSEKRPIFDGDKLALTWLCLQSFLGSCFEMAYWQPRLIFLLDGCPDSWADMVRHYVGGRGMDYEIVLLDGIGNQPSFHHQLQLAVNSVADFIYFAEDDYLYRPEAMREMHRVALSAPAHVFWTPYDHPDRYTRDDDRNGGPAMVRVIGSWAEREVGMWEHDGWHWRTIESACMTFGGPKDLFVRNYDLLHTHACTGRYLWYPVIDRGCELWGALPSLATHVRDRYLSMCINWNDVAAPILVDVEEIERWR